MKAWIVIIAAVFVNIAAAGECDTLPSDMNLESCCKFPALGNQDSIKKVAEQFKDSKFEPLLLECKVTEAMFKELKLAKDNGVDCEAMKTHIKSEIKEANWQPVLSKAVEDCNKYVNDEKDKILSELEKSPFNIKKDQCNALYMTLVTCIHLEGFENCPKDVWTEEKKCNDAKAWVQKCGDDIASWKLLVSKKERK